LVPLGGDTEADQVQRQIPITLSLRPPGGGEAGGGLVGGLTGGGGGGGGPLPQGVAARSLKQKEPLGQLLSVVQEAPHAPLAAPQLAPQRVVFPLEEGGDAGGGETAGGLTGGEEDPPKFEEAW